MWHLPYLLQSNHFSTALLHLQPQAISFCSPLEYEKTF